MSHKQHIIVVGGGFGGMAAAVRLAAQGCRVTLYEGRDKLGGRAYPLQINGFTFDSGPTVITAPYQFDDLFTAAGRRREDYFTLTPLDPFYRIFDAHGQHFDYRRHPDDMLTEIARWHPPDMNGYRHLSRSIKRVFDNLYPSMEQPFSHISDLLAIMPHVLKDALFQDMYGYVSRFIQHDFLRQVFSFHPLLVGGSPLDTPAVFSLIVEFEQAWGVHYAPGGTSAIVAAFARLLDELGVQVCLNTEIRQITLNGRRAAGVTLADGTHIPADAVICNADVSTAYHHLLPDASRFMRWRVGHMAYSNSLVVIYFGTKHHYQESPLLHHNLILGQDYRALLRQLFKHNQLPETPLLYLHMPSRTDPTVAPPGCAAFYVLALVPHLDRPIDWKAFAPRYRDGILALLEDRFLPGLRENIVAQHMIDPLHFRDVLKSEKGAAFATRPVLMQSSWFRPHNQPSGIDGLYFVGAGTHPGAGVPAVLASGKIAVDLIMGEG